MKKTELLKRIIAQLSHDLEVQFNAARTAHEAATHSENIPDNKYDTLALEASYVAQGQANRASEIRRAIEIYRQLKLKPIEDNEITMTALVTLEAEDGTTKAVFIGPLEGGLKIATAGAEIVVITPGSPLGQELLGKTIGDTICMGIGANRTDYEIIEVS